MSELTEPVVSLEFYQITRRGGELRAEAADFSQLLKMFIARGAGEASILSLGPSGRTFRSPSCDQSD